jgi:hypothetical protein
MSSKIVRQECYNSLSLTDLSKQKINAKLLEESLRALEEEELLEQQQHSSASNSPSLSNGEQSNNSSSNESHRKESPPQTHHQQRRQGQQTTPAVAIEATTTTTTKSEPLVLSMVSNLPRAVAAVVVPVATEVEDGKHQVGHFPLLFLHMLFYFL